MTKLGKVPKNAIKHYFKKGQLVKSVFDGKVYLDKGNSYIDIQTGTRSLPVQFRNAELWKVTHIEFRGNKIHTLVD